jgi:hypothetical protein
MDLSPSWEAKSRSATQEIPNFYEARKFITVFTRALHCPLNPMNPVYTTSSFSLRSFLILPSEIELKDLHVKVSNDIKIR